MCFFLNNLNTLLREGNPPVIATMSAKGRGSTHCLQRGGGRPIVRKNERKCRCRHRNSPRIGEKKQESTYFFIVCPLKPDGGRFYTSVVDLNPIIN